MAGKLPDRLENDDDYNAMLGRLVNGSEMIEKADPLDDEKLAKLWAVYNAMDGLIDDYKERDWRELHERAARLYERQAVSRKEAR